MKRIEKKQVFLMIFSFFIAVFIWATVMEQKNPEKDYEIRSIPIKLEEGDLGPRSAGLTILKGQNQTISLRVKGMRNEIAAIDESRITAKVDISNVIVAGNYNLPIEVNLNHVGITMVDVQPTYLNLTVDQMITRAIPITINAVGDVNGAFAINDITCSPKSVTVTGPKSEVDMIKTAQITLKMTDVKKDYTEKQKIVLLGKDDKELRTQYTVKNIESADVFVSIYPVKNVMIKVNEVGQLSETLEFDGYTIEPETVIIVGDGDYLADIFTVITEPIDLSAITQTTEFNVKLALPAGIKTAEEDFSCKVTVNVREREARPVKIQRYEVVNVAQGNTVQYDPLELEAILLGTAENFERLDTNQITAVIDLNNVYYAPGEVVKCPVNIVLPEGANLAVSGEYTKDVRIGT
jgi:YbbR domain-containing protein